MKSKNLRLCIKKKIIEDSKNDHNNSFDYEKENKKIHDETKHLINKTKRAIEDLDITHLRTNSPKPCNFSVSLDNRDKNTFYLISQQLVEKTKTINKLEKLIKEKDNTILQLNNKIDTKNKEIAKLNDSLNVTNNLYRKKRTIILN
jgi:hypothetical protein